MPMPEMAAPGVSRFMTAGQRERRLWERDWSNAHSAFTMFTSIWKSMQPVSQKI